MRIATPVLLSAVLLLAGCGPKRAKGPDWAVSAPAATTMALSAEAGWIIQRKEFQSLLGHYPLAERTLDLFLKRARINPGNESGRITFYAMEVKLQPEKPQGGLESSNFLLQLGGFQNPKNLLLAVTEAFPLEGSLQVGKREFPLYVLMDYNQFHMRILVDDQDRLWIGELSALNSLGKPRTAASPALRASEWIDARAPLQGLLLPEGLLNQASEKLPQEFAKELPKGIQALAWSVSPGGAKDAPHRFALAATGTPEGVQQLAPWIQRLVAFLGSMPGAPSHPADVLEDRGRIGLKAELNSAQLEAVMARISQPGITRNLFSGDRKP